MTRSRVLPARRSRDRRHRPDRVLAPRRPHRAATRERGDRRRVRRRADRRRRGRRSRQLHDRSGRGDRARPYGRAPGDRLFRARAVRRRRLDGCADARGRGRCGRRRRRRRRLPRGAGALGRDPLRRRQGRRDDRRQHPRRDDRDPVVHAARRAHARVVDGAQRDALHAPVRRDQRGLRPRGRAAARVRGDEPRRVGLRAADDARRPPGVALDRRTVHPHVRLLPGDRRSDRARRHQPRARRRHAAAARSGSPRSRAPGCSNRRSRPTTTGPTCRSWTRPSCSPGACSTTPGSGATRSTSR